MPEVIKDNREWLVTLTLPNTECPYLFFPRNIHGCKLRRDVVDDERCSKENCMMIDVDVKEVTEEQIEKLVEAIYYICHVNGQEGPDEQDDIDFAVAGILAALGLKRKVI